MTKGQPEPQTAAAALLPTTDPTNGGQINVSVAEYKALGLGPVASNQMAGYVGLHSSDSFTWSQTGGIASGIYDAVGTLEHEISEVFGRTDDLGNNYNNQVPDQYTLLDFYHYTAANGLATDTLGLSAGVLNEPFITGYNSNAFSYFSYNGKTVTLPYDTPAQVAAGNDVADWTNSGSAIGDSYGFPARPISIVSRRS